MNLLNGQIRQRIFQQIEAKSFALFSLLVLLSVFGLVSGLVSKAIFKLLVLFGYQDSAISEIVLDSEMGIQILGIVAALFVQKLVSKVHSLSGNSTEKQFHILPMQKWVDAVFSSFYKASFWVAAFVMSGIFVLEASLLVLRGSSQVFWSSALTWVFYVGVFWVWYIYLFKFRALVVESLLSLKLTKLSVFVVATVFESLLWVKVLGFGLDTYSGFIFDAGFFFLIGGIFAFSHVFDIISGGDAKRLLQKGASLFVFVFVFGCPLLKLHQPTLVALFPGPSIDRLVPMDTINSLTTFSLREILLSVLLVLGSNTLPQFLSLKGFKPRAQKLLKV